MRLWFAPGALVVALLGLTNARQMRQQGAAPSVLEDTLIVDSFDSVSQWVTNPAQGVEVTVHADSGLHGRGMRVDFDFHGHPGYWIVHRNVSLELPTNYEFDFALRGTAPINNLEFKLIDDTGANVWWSRSLNYDFPVKWHTIARSKREICFAWGPATEFDIHHVAAIEFAISTGTGGSGSIWIDDLRISPREQESPFSVIEPVDSAPIVGTWESQGQGFQPSGATLTFGADGSFGSVIGLMGDFDYRFAKNQLTFGFTPIRTGSREEQTLPIRIQHDTLFQPGLSLLGRNVTLKRLHPANANDDVIAGEWADVEGPEFVAFGQTGKAQFRLVTRSCSGSWSAANNHLVIKMNGETTHRDYSVENDVLTVHYPGRDVKYNRRQRLQ